MMLPWGYTNLGEVDRRSGYLGLSLLDNLPVLRLFRDPIASRTRELLLPLAIFRYIHDFLELLEIH